MPASMISMLIVHTREFGPCTSATRSTYVNASSCFCIQLFFSSTQMQTRRSALAYSQVFTTPDTIARLVKRFGSRKFRVKLMCDKCPTPCEPGYMVEAASPALAKLLPALQVSMKVWYIDPSHECSCCNGMSLLQLT